MKYSKDLLPITEICLNVTESCNLACRYCFTEHHPNFMTYQVAQDTVEWLYNNAKISSEIQKVEVIPTIGFFGGEPTLMWDSIIVPLVNYCKTNHKDEPINFGITSNCVLLDKDKVDFMCENNMGLLISMDGNSYTQCYNRPSKTNDKSFDLVMKNLPYISEKLPQSTYRSTIIPATCDHTFENIMFAGSMGFDNVFSIINEFEEWDEEHRELLQKEIEKYCLYVIDSCIHEEPFIKLRTFEQAINKVIAINTVEAFNPDTPQEVGPEESMRCGTGNGYGSVNYKGDIFACQEVASRQGEKNIFLIGNIYTGIDEKALLQLRQSILERKTKYANYLNSEKCNNCKVRQVCQANLCHVNNYILYKDFGLVPDCWCWWSNMMMNAAIFVMHVLGNNENEFFKDYLIKECKSRGGPLWHE